MLKGHFVVALHRVEAAAAELAVRADGREVPGVGVDDSDLDPGERLADRLALALDGRLEVARHRHHGARLGEAVRVRDLLHEHLVLRLLHPVDGAGRAAHDIIAAIIDLAFQHNQYAYYLGLGKNVWLFALVPFIILCKYSPNNQQIFLIDEQLKTFSRE